jgi:hypothetical protein
MSFAEKQKAITKTPVTKACLILDYCANTFGVSPCTATGTKCYNTYKTCVDKPNFTQTVKSYKSCSNNAPQSMIQLLNARPDLISAEYMATEIKEDKTITARINLTFEDEPDYDQDTDPYWATRTPNLLNRTGTRWKKLIERNPFYRGRLGEVYEGYEGILESEFVKRASAKIQNITRDGRNVKVELADDIADLSAKKHPYKSNIKLGENVGHCFDVKTRDEMLSLKNTVLNDFCVRRDFAIMNPVTALQTYPGGLTGLYYYQVVAFDALDRPFASSDQIIATLPFGSLENNFNISITWYDQQNASYYRVYKTSTTETKYLQTALLTITDDGTLNFPTTEDAPTEAVRYFKLTGEDPSDLNNWAEWFTPMTILLNGVTGLNTSGYLRLDDEVIYYNGITSLSLQNVARLQYKTKGARHYFGTNIFLVTWRTPRNPFTALEEELVDAAVAVSRIDTTTIRAYRDAWTGILVSTKPIIKETDAAKLIFDLCWVLDIRLWVNEEGLITCRYNSDETVDFTVTDAENIILNSKSIDYNQDEIRTRFLLYWNRKDVTKGNADQDNFANLHIEIDADAEGPLMYNKELPEPKTTLWINDDCGTVAEINAYLATLLNAKIKRARLPRPILTYEVEAKDSDIKGGQIGQHSTDAFNDIDGVDYNLKKAEVINKEPAGSKVKLTVKMLAEEVITTTSEDHVLIYENPVPVRSFLLTEVKVTGLTMIDSLGADHTGEALALSVENELKLRWDNMYMSEASTATDINGSTRSLPMIQAWSGMPPDQSPVGDPYVDTSGWKTTRKYNVYMFVAAAGQTAPAVNRPTANEVNGKWYLIASVPDNKIDDATKKYFFTKVFSLPLAGRYVCFDVYADANLVYDSNAPVSVQVEKAL